MKNKIPKTPPFRCRLNFRLLIDHLNGSFAHQDVSSHIKSSWSENLEKVLKEAPELLDPIDDMEILARRRKSVLQLMSLMFPPVVQDNEMICASIPGTFYPVFATSLFRKTFLNEDNTFKNLGASEKESIRQARMIRSYLFILDKFFNIECDGNYPVISRVPDPETGLDRYFRLESDFRFTEAYAKKTLPEYSEKELAGIRENYSEPDVLKQMIRPDDFELQGLTIIRPVDITRSEVLIALGNDLTDKESVNSAKGFIRLQQRLRTYFRIPDLKVNLTVIQNEKVMLLNSGKQIKHQCIFADSSHANLSEFNGTPYEKAFRERKIIRISDVQKCNGFLDTKKSFYPHDIRSLMIAPLVYEGKCLGALTVGSPRAGELCPVNALFMTQVQPLFAITINRTLEDLENRIENVIKEQFTAIHPVVEWRFRKTVLNKMESLHEKKTAAGYDTINLRKVYPVYGG